MLRRLKRRLLLLGGTVPDAEKSNRLERVAESKGTTFGSTNRVIPTKLDQNARYARY